MPGSLRNSRAASGLLRRPRRADGMPTIRPRTFQLGRAATATRPKNFLLTWPTPMAWRRSARSAVWPRPGAAAAPGRHALVGLADRRGRCRAMGRRPGDGDARRATSAPGRAKPLEPAPVRPRATDQGRASPSRLGAPGDEPGLAPGPDRPGAAARGRSWASTSGPGTRQARRSKQWRDPGLSRRPSRESGRRRPPTAQRMMREGHRLRRLRQGGDATSDHAQALQRRTKTAPVEKPRFEPGKLTLTASGWRHPDRRSENPSPCGVKVDAARRSSGRGSAPRLVSAEHAPAAAGITGGVSRRSFCRTGARTPLTRRCRGPGQLALVIAFSGPADLARSGRTDGDQPGSRRSSPLESESTARKAGAAAQPRGAACRHRAARSRPSRRRATGDLTFTGMPQASVLARRSTQRRPSKPGRSTAYKAASGSALHLRRHGESLMTHGSASRYPRRFTTAGRVEAGPSRMAEALRARCVGCSRRSSESRRLVRSRRC